MTVHKLQPGDVVEGPSLNPNHRWYAIVGDREVGYGRVSLIAWRFVNATKDWELHPNGAIDHNATKDWELHPNGAIDHTECFKVDDERAAEIFADYTRAILTGEADDSDQG